MELRAPGTTRASSKTYRWRKVTDINREHALFELLEGGTVTLDVGFDNEGLFEIAFSEGISGRVIQFDLLERLLKEGRVLAELDQ